MENWTASEDATRLLASSDIYSGYLYIWLESDYGQCLLKRQLYGSVIVHIDREMIASIPIPLPENNIINEIGNLVLQANQLRDQAWHKEQDAINQLENLIKKKQPSEAKIEINEEVPMDKQITFDPNARPIWEILAELSAQIPDEEWKQVPSDLARNFDKYQTETIEDEE